MKQLPFGTPIDLFATSLTALSAKNKRCTYNGGRGNSQDRFSAPWEIISDAIFAFLATWSPKDNSRGSFEGTGDTDYGVVADVLVEKKTNARGFIKHAAHHCHLREKGHKLASDYLLVSEKKAGTTKDYPITNRGGVFVPVSLL